MNSFKKTALILLSAISCVNANAMDLGVVGPVYDISEPDALEQIHTKLKQLEASGELKRKEKEAIERAKNSVKNPKPVEGLTTVEKFSKRPYDPTYTVPENITTEDGRIIAVAGTQINPLKIMNLTKTLVFFDGRDKEQVAGVKRLIDKYGSKIKPILVAGEWIEISKAWKKPVYFDQQGILTKQLGLRAVPSILRQNGKMLEIAEIPAKELDQ